MLMSDEQTNLPWFRMYAEFANDPVVQMLAFEDQRHFVMLLCYKCSGLLDREFSSPEKRVEVIRRGLGLSGTAWDEMQARLTALDLIDDELQPLNWDKRQFRSDSSKERVRAHRQRKKQQEEEGKRLCNVTVTPQESESESDKEQTDRQSGSPPPVVDNSQKMEFLQISEMMIAAGTPGAWLANAKDKDCLNEWIALGVTPADMQDAIKRAKAAKKGESFGALYLHRIVTQVINARLNPGSKKPGKPRTSSSNSIRFMGDDELIKFGRKLGVVAEHGELMPDFRKRIYAANEKQKAEA